MTTPEDGASKYGINIIHVVKFIFNNVRSCKHDMREKYVGKGK